MSPSPDAQGVLDRLEAEGRAHIPIPRWLTPGQLAATLLDAGRVASEVAAARPDDLFMGVVRGAKIRKPTSEWVWIYWTEAGADKIDDATRRELGL
jgi:hypothetical protein